MTFCGQEGLSFVPVSHYYSCLEYKGSPLLSRWWVTLLIPQMAQDKEGCKTQDVGHRMAVCFLSWRT